MPNQINFFENISHFETFCRKQIALSAILSRSGVKIGAIDLALNKIIHVNINFSLILINLHTVKTPFYELHFT